MSLGQLIPANQAIKVLFDRYKSGASLSQAQLDCLVEHGLLKTQNGAYWATDRAFSLPR